jgi:hypothetical protein
MKQETLAQANELNEDLLHAEDNLERLMKYFCDADGAIKLPTPDIIILRGKDISHAFSIPIECNILHFMSNLKAGMELRIARLKKNLEEL